MANNIVPFRSRQAVFPAPRAGTPPRRLPNRRRRSREHLTAAEVERLIEAARTVGRYGKRDAALILIAYRHGLRVSELVGLAWDQVDFERGTLHVNRVKRGDAATHPLARLEVTALTELRASNRDTAFVFISERGGRLTAATVRKIVARSGRIARLGFPVHPPMFRHATGYYLANNGVDTRTIQAYLGHRNIMHTVRYTQLAADRFRALWRDP
jgi:type 1 fimbriae regulatory protein FimB/type 1 fimbriae regulatory protein FimE